MAKPTNPQAFPGSYGTPGMSLRDYFAGQALAGMLARGPDGLGSSDKARVAYGYADDMLAERGEPRD